MKKATGPFHKDSYFYRRSDPPWAIRLYRKNTWDKGDLLSNTLKKIIDDEDFSEWAYISLGMCFGLLKEGKRWPDPFSQDIDCKTIACFYWQKIKFQALKLAERLKADKIANSIHCKFGLQKNPSRDPWTYAMVAAYKMNRFEYFTLRPQRRLWRPGFWAWMNYLESGGDPKWKRRYYFWKRFTHSKKDYVPRQQRYREMVFNSVL